MCRTGFNIKFKLASEPFPRLGNLSTCFGPERYIPMNRQLEEWGRFDTKSVSLEPGQQDFHESSEGSGADPYRRITKRHGLGGSRTKNR